MPVTIVLISRMAKKKTYSECRDIIFDDNDQANTSFCWMGSCSAMGPFISSILVYNSLRNRSKLSTVAYHRGGNVYAMETKILS